MHNIYAVVIETFSGKDKGGMEKVLLTLQLSPGVQAEFRSNAVEIKQQLLRNQAIRNANARRGGAGGADVTHAEHPNTLGPSPGQLRASLPPPSHGGQCDRVCRE